MMKPRLKKIVLADWPALFCLIAIPGIWVIGFVFPFIRAGARSDRIAMLSTALPLSLIAAGFFLWRIRRIQMLFSRGAAVRGYITRIRLARDRGRVEFFYEFSGRRFESWMPVHQNPDVLALRVSQEIELLVDSACPRRAIIRHLFV
jgi:hypothetical protein